MRAKSSPPAPTRWWPARRSSAPTITPKSSPGCAPPDRSDSETVSAVAECSCVIFEIMEIKFKVVSPRAARLRTTSFCQSRQKEAKTLFTGGRTPGCKYDRLGGLVSDLVFADSRTPALSQFKWIGWRSYLKCKMLNDVANSFRTDKQRRRSAPGPLPCGPHFFERQARFPGTLKPEPRNRFLLNVSQRPKLLDGLVVQLGTLAGGIAFAIVLHAVDEPDAQ